MSKGKKKSPGKAGVTRPRTLSEMKEAGCIEGYFHDLAAHLRTCLPDLGDGSGRRCRFVLVVGGLAGEAPRMVSDLGTNADIREFLAAIVKDIDSRTMDDGVLVSRDKATGELREVPMPDPPGRQPLPAGKLPPRQKVPKSWLPTDYTGHEGEDR